MDEQVIWEGTLDDRYECKVVRTGSHTGQLTVMDGEKVLLNEEVGLEYGAIFGPSPYDILFWQHKCVKAVENSNG